jgi:PrcB C-terminal
MKKLVALGLVAASLVAATAAVTLRPVEFRTIARGNSGAITQRTQFVVRDVGAWRRLWRRLQGGRVPAPRLPRVDFSRYMLIAVTQGQQRTGGYSIRVKSIEEDSRRLRVTVAERAPGQYCVTPQLLTEPYVVVRLKRSAKRVVFTRQRTVYDCPPY